MIHTCRHLFTLKKECQASVYQQSVVYECNQMHFMAIFMLDTLYFIFSQNQDVSVCVSACIFGFRPVLTLADISNI